MVDLHGVKVASFLVEGQELICLPQVFDLFLKHLVGGLHTVYTKLKRLDISPVVCTVEQLAAETLPDRAARHSSRYGHAAIVPGLAGAEYLLDPDIYHHRDNNGGLVLILILCEKSMEGVGDKHPAAILHAAEFPNADGFLLMCCSMQASPEASTELFVSSFTPVAMRTKNLDGDECIKKL
ncbi:Dachshund-like protein 2 [Anas platyrhynchos]|uniref:Dachshund-like protein 2 n=1 Tax=Anas platyrhynchos TaxID=8839 RepID=R0M3I7_ANAPL|nr:Dachshund-like protein 2 [Anas platyrhynchos]